MKFYFTFLFTFLILSGAFAQKKQIKEGIESGRNKNTYYKVSLDKGKILKEDKLTEYCNENDILLKNITYQSVNRFGDKDKGVLSFEFLPKTEIEKFVFENKLANTRTSPTFQEIQNKQKGIVYFFDPLNKKFIQLNNTFWTGNLVNGKVNGEGIGYISNGNTYYLFQGNFKEGILLKNGEFKVYSHVSETYPENGSNYSKSIFLTEFSDGLAALKYDNKIGFIDSQMNTKIQPQFNKLIQEFQNGKAIVVNSSNEEILIDKTGSKLDYTDNQKELFIAGSSNLTTLLQNKNNYPNIKYDYDTKVLQLTQTVDDLALIPKISSNAETLNKGKEKVDDILWQNAMNENTFGGYALYIYNAPLKLKHQEASDRMHKIQTTLKNELLSYLKNKDITGAYNFYLKHKNANDSWTKDLANLAFETSIALSNENINNFNNEVKYDPPNSSLVKIILSSKDGRPLFPEKGKIINFLDVRYSQSYHLGVFFGMSANQDKLFPTIYTPQYYNNLLVINALWYRKGTDKDGDWLTQNSGFKAFKEKLYGFANSNNMSVDYIEYLGSYSDDIARSERRRIAEQNFRQEQCDRCAVNRSKTKTPQEFDISYFDTNGTIYMQNGDDYSWNYKKDGGYKVINDCLFCSDDSFDSWEGMIADLVRRCRENRCN